MDSNVLDTINGISLKIVHDLNTFINANLKLSHFRWKRSSESEPLEIFPVTI
jgi:hypothetical protein